MKKLPLNSISTTLKPKYAYLILLSLFWLLYLSIKNPFLSDKYATQYYGFTRDESIILNTDDVLDQSFVCSMNGLTNVTVTFCGVASQLQEFTIELWDMTTQDLITSTLVTSDNIASNMFFHKTTFYSEQTVSFDTIEDSYGKPFVLRITNVSPVSTGEIGVAAHDNLSDNETTSLLNKENLNLSSNFSLDFTNKTTNLIYYFIWGLLIAASYICVLLINNSFHRNFVVIGVICGLLWIFINPFPHQIDEATHFFRSFAISQGSIHDTYSSSGQIGAIISDNYEAVLNTPFTMLTWYANKDFWAQPFSTNTEFYANMYMSSVIPIDHIISSIGILLGNIFHLSIASTIILSRLADLIFYLTFCYFAIKQANYYKSIFFGVSLLPMCMMLAGSCSQDPIITGASIFFISYCLNILLSSKDNSVLTAKDYFLLLLPLPFIASIKYLIYVPIYFMIFLIPKKRFKKYHKYFFFGAIGLITGILLIYQIYLLKAFPYVENRNGNVNVSEQIHFVFNDLYLFYRNFGTYFFDTLLHHIQNSFMNTSNYFLSSMAALFVVFGSIFANDKYSWKSTKQQWTFTTTFVVSSIIMWGLTICALYAGFTPVGTWGIHGVQPRYTFPFLPLICIALSTISVTNNIKNYEKKYSFIMILANIYSIASNCIIDRM